MNTSDLIIQFLENLLIRNYSSRTRKDYGYHLKYLVEFLKQNQINDLSHVTPSHILDFQRWIYYQPTTHGKIRGVLNQNCILTVIKSFFKYLHQREIISTNPTLTIQNSRIPRTLPRNILTPQEIQKIMDQVETTTLLGIRNRTILEVLYSTGMRRNEIRNLSVGDLNLNGGMIHIFEGKGKYSRMVPLTKSSIQFLKKYLNEVRPLLIEEGRKLGKLNQDKLFLSYQGSPLDSNTTGKFIKRYAKKARLKKEVGNHIIRHSVSISLLKNNMNLRLLQIFLGHRSLVTTSKYLHLTIEDLKKAHRKFHPRNSFR